MSAAPRPPDVVVTGYPSIDFVARIERPVTPGWTGIITSLWDGPTYGGCAPNVAVGLARLGIRSAVAMIVGDDDEGRRYLAHLEREGVDTRGVLKVAGRPTSRTFLFVPAAGATSLFFAAGAAAEWNGTLQLDFSGARFAVLTVGPRAYNVRFAELAIAASVPLAWQLKGDLTAYPQDVLPQLLANSRFIFMNQQEARYLCNAVGAANPQTLIGRGPEALFITHGGEGSEVVSSSGTSRIPAVRVEVADPTGAGDAFTAGVLAAIVKGWQLDDAARFGAVVASFVVETRGCQTGLPDWEAALSRYTKVKG